MFLCPLTPSSREEKKCKRHSDQDHSKYYTIGPSLQEIAKYTPMRVVQDYQAKDSDELSVRRNDLVTFLQRDLTYGDWSYVALGRSALVGFIPTGILRECHDEIPVRKKTPHSASTNQVNRPHSYENHNQHSTHKSHQDHSGHHHHQHNNNQNYQHQNNHTICHPHHQIPLDNDQHHQHHCHHHNSQRQHHQPSHHNHLHHYHQHKHRLHHHHNSLPHPVHDGARYSNIHDDRGFHNGNVHNDDVPFHRRPWGSYLVLYEYRPCNENDIGVDPNEAVTVLNKDDPDWFWVARNDDQEGFVPARFLCPYETVLDLKAHHRSRPSSPLHQRRDHLYYNDSMIRVNENTMDENSGIENNKPIVDDLMNTIDSAIVNESHLGLPLGGCSPSPPGSANIYQNQDIVPPNDSNSLEKN